MSQPSGVVAIREGFTDEQVDIIRRQIAPSATNDELALFLQYCQRTGLDPFSRQIYLSERRSKDPKTGNWVTKRQPETTIDGFRLIAERSGKYAGQQEPMWCGYDGIWVDIWLDDAPPVAAKVAVLRHDFNTPMVGKALWREYVQMTGGDNPKPNSMWAKMGTNQLAKCAEALALRKAFPRELSGLYAKEEMGQAEQEERGSKEAAQAVATRKIEELSQPKQIESAQVIEDTHAEKQREAEEILNAAATPPEVKGQEPKPRAARTKTATPAPAVSFEMLEAFHALKKELKALSGSDNLYYEVLGQAGYAKSNLIPDRIEGTKVYKMLAAALGALKAKQADRAEMMEFMVSLGSERFWRIVGAAGFDEPMLADIKAEELSALLVELREAVK